jgi:hypothetical protein
MNTKDAILYVLNTARYVTNAYLSDLSDQELLIRPTPGAHHIAWQIGHLLLSEAMMVNAVTPGSAISFPAGFEVLHAAPKGPAEPAAAYADSAVPGAFYTKDRYVDLRTRLRAKTLELIDSIPLNELDAPGPEKMRAYAPTKGAVLLAIGTHEMMHSGQWAVVRRYLNKPVVV